MFQRSWETLVGLSTVTDCSVIYSNENLQSSAVPASRTHSSTTKVSGAFRRACPCCCLQAKKSHSSPWSLSSNQISETCLLGPGYSTWPQVLVLLLSPGQYFSQAYESPSRARLYYHFQNCLLSSGNVPFSYKKSLLNTLTNHDHRSLAFLSYFPAEKQQLFSRWQFISLVASGSGHVTKFPRQQLRPFTKNDSGLRNLSEGNKNARPQPAIVLEPLFISQSVSNQRGNNLWWLLTVGCFPCHLT